MTGHTDETATEMSSSVEIIMNLMATNLRDYQSTTAVLIGGYQRRIAELEAELGVVRAEINNLFGGAYMPNESAILRAVFHPSREQIKEVAEAKLLKEMGESR